MILLFCPFYNKHTLRVNCLPTCLYGCEFGLELDKRFWTREEVSLGLGGLY